METTLPQSQALKSAGCTYIQEEQASGGNRARPVLARVPGRINKGDTLVVVLIDRLARSLSHLLEAIDRLETKGAFFRSLEDPIDTASSQGKFTLQVLGAAAEFERALIRDRTRAGLASARTQGRVGGNPGLRAKDPAAFRKVRLARAVNAYARDGFLPATVPGRAGRRERDDRLPAIVAAIKGANPSITLQTICERLRSMRERTPRGRTSWQPSSV